MRGLSIRLLQRLFLVNLLLVISILVGTYYMNIESISQYSFLQVLFNLKTMLYIYIVKSDYFEVYMIVFILINLYVLYWAMKNYKYLNLPYAIGLKNEVRQFEGDEKRTNVWFDKFIKKTKYKNFYMNNNFSIFFKNWVSIDIKSYEVHKERIAQYLGWEGDIKIFKYGAKGVELFFYKLPSMLYGSIGNYQKGSLHYGVSIYGDYRIDFDHLTHTVVVGESGSGKSNFMHHILHSFMANKDSIDSIDLIDLKGTELYRYRNIDYMNFIDDVVQVRDRLLLLKDEMENRFKYMKRNNEQLYSGNYHLIVFDEVGTLGLVHSDKKLRDEIINLMVEVSQKGRAAKILFYFFLQKLDSKNLDSNILANVSNRILMKTDSDFNINNTIGTKEDIGKITLLNPDSFPKGRAIIRDGYTSEKVLIQVPLIQLKKDNP